MKIVIAPNAFKGSLTAVQAADAIATGLQQVFPEAELVRVPIADGGDGTVDALVAAAHGERRTARVTGPLGEPVEAAFGLLDSGRVAVIEMAQAAGLLLVPPERRDPTITSTAGVGELLRHALQLGARRLIVGIGGSATNDAGAGMAQALGYRLRDAAGRDLERGGRALRNLATIDGDGVDPRWRQISVEVAVDVTNPLTGPQGASAVYGPQKGASPAQVAELDAALTHFGHVVRRELGIDVMSIPGGGAAGGLGAGLAAFLGARLRPGAPMVMEVLGMRERLRGATLAVTGEGRMDAQTAFGKAPACLAALARELGVPVIALAGSLGPDAEALQQQGIVAAVALADGPLRLDETMARAAELLTAAAVRAGRMLRLGMDLG